MWNFVARTEEQSYDVWEWSAEEIIWAKLRGSKMNMGEIT